MYATTNVDVHEQNIVLKNTLLFPELSCSLMYVGNYRENGISFTFESTSEDLDVCNVRRSTCRMRCSPVGRARIMGFLKSLIAPSKLVRSGPL